MDFTRDHFALFGLEPRFRLDVEALDRAYRELQAEIHPDRFAHAGEADQRLAVQWATRANEAYQTLKKPFERARYLLELRGIHALDARNTALPAAFLMRQMEWREALADAVAGQDGEALQSLEDAARAESKRLLADLARWLDDERDDSQATEAVRQYRFLDKFLADIGAAYDEL